MAMFKPEWQPEWQAEGPERVAVDGVLPLGFPTVIDRRASLLVLGGSPGDPVTRALADGAELRLAAIDAAAARLAMTVAVDVLLLDIAGEAGMDAAARLDALLDAVASWPGLRDGQCVVRLSPAQIDAVYARLGDGGATLLCGAMPSDVAVALCEAARAARAPSATLHDVTRDAENARIRELSEEVRRLARTIDRLAGERSSGDRASSDRASSDRAERGLPGAPGLRDAADPVIARSPFLPSDGAAPMLPPTLAPASADADRPPVHRSEVRTLVQARRLRDRALPADLFADPAWDMILDLFDARLAGKRVSVSSLCIAACVPQTTALRWIGQLVDRGIFERSNDPADARRVFIALSDAAADSVADWFAAARRAGLGFGR